MGLGRQILDILPMTGVISQHRQACGWQSDGDPIKHKADIIQTRTPINAIASVSTAAVGKPPSAPTTSKTNSSFATNADGGSASTSLPRTRKGPRQGLPDR